MNGRPRPLLDALTKSGFDEEDDDLSTADGDPNHVLDEYAPSADYRLRGGRFAGRAKAKSGRLPAVRLDVWPRTNDLRAALHSA